MPTPSPSGPSADSLFAAWLARHEAGEKADFEALCREHFAAADELRELHRYWSKVEAVRRQHGLGGSLSEKLKSQYGGSVDPQVTLEGEEQVKGDFSSEVLSRLAGRGPASTRYRVKGEVAHGGMGAVLRVWDEDLRRHLAMKVMLGKGGVAEQGDTPQADLKMLARFLEEAQVTGQLDHPGIVPVHELGLDAEGRVYFTMKLVKGKTLKEVFDELSRGEGGWTQTRVLGLIQKVCEAMSYAHAKGVIHRDLKPANVMVGKFGEVFVMDWGLAKVLGREDEKDIRISQEPVLMTSAVRSERHDFAGETPDSPLYTMDGDVVGTPAYMPPEQAKGELAAMGPHSDVYAVGAMLYHLLAGHMPYLRAGEKASNYAVWRWLKDGPPTSLDKEASNTPAELIAICDKAMSRDSTARYLDMVALAADLLAYVEGRVVSAYETGTWAETRKWVRRNRALAFALAAAFVVLLASASFIALLYREANRLQLRDFVRGLELEEALVASRQRTADVLSLSAQMELDELVKEADSLWPAVPAGIPDYEDWLQRARGLIDGRPADTALGVTARPSLGEHKARLARIRRDAKLVPLRALQAGGAALNKLAELATKQAELQWQSRMLGLEPWPTEAEVEATLSREVLPKDARELNELAWRLVDPANPVYGQEVRALLLANRAFAAAGMEFIAHPHHTMVWADFRLGRFDTAQANMRLVLRKRGGEALRPFAAELEQAIASWQGEELARRRHAHDALVDEVLQLHAELSEEYALEFDDPGQAWWNRQLSMLVSDLDLARDSQKGLMGDTLASPFGWGVAKRCQFAKTIEARSVTGTDAQRRWTEAIDAIGASPRYAGLELKPQHGILPIGVDPESGLWEFAHLQTGEPAERRSDGRLVITEAMGLVFVLIPGGKFWMGAQATDPNGRNYDPNANADEGPVHEVELSPFFLSKYEMSQGQWERIAARNPSNYGPSNYAPKWNRARKGWTSLHPVEQVSWKDCVEMTARLELTLPSEAQWEYAGRAGTGTAYWSGDDPKSLAGAANLNDAYGKAHGNESFKTWETDLDDGQTCHAEIGAYDANGFGLHDTHGNVAEWCLDVYVDDIYKASATQDPVAPTPWLNNSPNSVYRGGSFLNTASSVRSARRSRNSRMDLDSSLGLRPARAIAR